MRIENISTTAFARDYHMDGHLAATEDGKILGLKVDVVADHGAFDACADPTKFPAGLFHICSGSYDIPAAHCSVKGVYTNKAPGGVAYRCSFRVTEAVYLIERMVDVLAQKLNMDKAEIRRKNFIRKEQFPYTSAFGFEYCQVLRISGVGDDWPVVVRDVNTDFRLETEQGVRPCPFVAR